MFLLFFIVHSPNGKQLAFNTFWFFSFFPIVFIIPVFVIFLILSDHSLHDLGASLEGSRIPSWLWTFLFLISAFILNSSFFFQILNVVIPNIPLSDFTTDVDVCWELSCGSSFFHFWVNCLNFSSVIVELIPHGLFDGCISYIRYLPHSCLIQVLLFRLELCKYWNSFCALLQFALVSCNRWNWCGHSHLLIRSERPIGLLRQSLCLFCHGNYMSAC